MKQLKKEMNEIIIKITEEELLQNIKNTEERIMNNTIINKRWLTEEEWAELTPRELRIRELKSIHRRINEVINLLEERNEIYETFLAYMLQDETENIEQRKEMYELTLAYMLQDETRKIERIKKELERKFFYETHKRKGEDYNIIKELANVIGWIEEEQEKFKL